MAVGGGGDLGLAAICPVRWSRRLRPGDPGLVRDTRALGASAPGMVVVASFFVGMVGRVVLPSCGGSCSFPAGGVGAAGSVSIKEVVLDPSQAKTMIYRMLVSINLISMSCSGRLRRRMEHCILCLEFAGSGGIRSRAPMLLFRPFGSGGSDTKLCSVLPADDILVHGVSETENFLKTDLED